MLLRVEGITVHYEKAKALDDVTFEVAEGAVVAIIGSNGAGKSTILKALSGLKPLTSGRIWFLDNRIDGMAIHDIVGWVSSTFRRADDSSPISPYYPTSDWAPISAKTRYP